jgi:hypothetical protein
MIFVNYAKASSLDSTGVHKNTSILGLDQMQLSSLTSSKQAHRNEQASVHTPKVQDVGICRIHIHTEFDNGVVIDGTVEIEGIPWYKCLAIKAIDFFSNGF